MKMRADSKSVFVAVVAAWLAFGPVMAAETTGDASSGDGLKWTPHRPTRLADASTATSAPAVAPSTAPEPPAPMAPMVPQAAPPAAVASPAAVRGPGASLPPATVRPDPPSAPFDLTSIRLPPMQIFRAPTPIGGRAPGYPSRSEAPRFGSAATASVASQRPPRYAMNADDLPSVMARPQERPAGAATAPSTNAPKGDAATPDTLPKSGGPAAGELPPPMTAETFGPEYFPADQGMPMAMDVGSPSAGMWMGGYPSDGCYDPYAVDACCPEDQCGFVPGCSHSGRICNWLRQFGRPYYGWRWYRDFTASVGVTGFQTPVDLGIAGNFGTNEYANFGMPFWNAFGIGWQLGIRGVQTHFQQTSIEGLDDEPFVTGARDQVFVTTGFYTRAFEGRGLQFGCVWDYLRDNWYDNVDLAQLRGEISYVWHAQEVGFWGTANYDTTPFGTRRFSGNASTIDLYTGFYRLHFGDGNEWKLWGGATENGDGLVGSLLRAPMTRSLALEGTFTYLIPKDTKTYPLGTATGQESASITTSDAAWNVSVNVVFYPACRSRRGQASPYRPLFEVADNGSMIRSLEGLVGPTSTP